MSVYACVLVELERGSAIHAAEQLRSSPAVGLAVPTAGPYDLLVLAQAEDPVTLGKIIVNEFQEVPGVKSTLTLIILDEIIPTNWLENKLTSL